MFPDHNKLINFSYICNAELTCWRRRNGFKRQEYLWRWRMWWAPMAVLFINNPGGLWVEVRVNRIKSKCDVKLYFIILFYRNETDVIVVDCVNYNNNLSCEHQQLLRGNSFVFEGRRWEMIYNILVFGQPVSSINEGMTRKFRGNNWKHGRQTIKTATIGQLSGIADCVQGS